MANTYFQFKQFRIDQGSCAMKISTDAVLLGALTGSKVPNTVLDIGTGTGVIALMLAQRNSEATVTALEIDAEAFLQATENVRNSPWSSRIKVVGSALQVYQTWGKKVDLIVSNPPYFPNHLASGDIRRSQALHQYNLTFRELLAGVEILLEKDGEFWVILPERQMAEFTKLGNNEGFIVFVRIEVRDSPGKPVLRVIQAFGRSKWFASSPLVPEELVIKEETGVLSANYRQLLKEFMLHF